MLRLLTTQNGGAAAVRLFFGKWLEWPFDSDDLQSRVYLLFFPFFLLLLLNKRPIIYGGVLCRPSGSLLCLVVVWLQGSIFIYWPLKCCIISKGIEASWVCALGDLCHHFRYFMMEKKSWGGLFISSGCLVLCIAPANILVGAHWHNNNQQQHKTTRKNPNKNISLLGRPSKRRSGRTNEFKYRIDSDLCSRRNSMTSMDRVLLVYLRLMRLAWREKLF